MKKFLLAFALLVCTSAFAEKKVASYNLGGKNLDIEASCKNNRLSIFIEVMGKYEYDKVFIRIKGEKNIQLFRRSLDEMKNKFIEWSEVAEKNGVSDFEKYYDLSWPAGKVYWCGVDKWHSCRLSGKSIHPLFMIKGKPSAAFLGKAQCWNNKIYITQNWYLFFSDADEFQSLLDAVDIEKIKDHFKKDAKTELLFK